MTGRRRIALMQTAALALAASLIPVSPTRAAGAPAYATIMFGRSAWTSSYLCVPDKGAPTLEAAVADLTAKGGRATLGVVPGFTLETARSCDGSTILYPSWADLARLRDRYGATVVSQSLTYIGWVTASTQQQFYAESCGSLPAFTAHGHLRAHGMFNYPANDFWDNPIAASTVDSCFSFGRRYGGGLNTPATAAPAPHLIRTWGINAGACNAPTLPCYVATVTPQQSRYTLPADIIARLAYRPGTYVVVQFYRFARSGSARLTGPGAHWNCHGPVETHWSSRQEIYCYNDWLTITSALDPRLTWTDPLTVADAWGITP